MYRTRSAMKRSGTSALLAVIAGLSMLLSACATGPAANSGGGSDYDLSKYERVTFDPVSVEFDPNWKPIPTGSHISLGAREREEIKEFVAALFNEEFSEGLTQGGHVQVVDRAGPGVLRVTPELQDVYLSAPSPMSRPGATYVRSVGHMTLHLVFRDASTGEVVLELHDRVRGRDIGLLRSANAVYNELEMRRMFADWAQVIRQDLFRAP